LSTWKALYEEAYTFRSISNHLSYIYQLSFFLIYLFVNIVPRRIPI